jgi:ribosomal protein L23
LFVFVFASG